MLDNRPISGFSVTSAVSLLPRVVTVPGSRSQNTDILGGLFPQPHVPCL